MNIIACVNNSFGIGVDNNLLIDNCIDKAYFKRLTKHKVVVMGSTTYLSIPNRPLVDRINIVFSHKTKFDKVINVASLQEFFEAVKDYNSNDVFVCGGAQIYNMLFDYCDRAYINKINTSNIPNKYIMDFDNLDMWQQICKKKEREIEFCIYERSC